MCPKQAEQPDVAYRSPLSIAVPDDVWQASEDDSTKNNSRVLASQDANFWETPETFPHLDDAVPKTLEPVEPVLRGQPRGLLPEIRPKRRMDLD